MKTKEISFQDSYLSIGRPDIGEDFDIALVTPRTSASQIEEETVEQVKLSIIASCERDPS